MLEKLKTQLKRDEGVEYVPYQDTTGVWTWGIGRNLEANPLTTQELVVLLTQGPEAAAELCLSNDLSRVFTDLDKAIPWWKELEKSNEARAGVLANMCFNLGLSRFLGFENTLRDIREARYSSAATRLRASRWARQVGPRAVRLINQLLTGSWK